MARGMTMTVPVPLPVDGSGKVYVTGENYSSGPSSSSAYATIKYNASGTEEWVARYNGPGVSDDYATAIAVDGSGNVYVTGQSVGSGTNYDYATIKYSQSKGGTPTPTATPTITPTATSTPTPSATSTPRPTPTPRPRPTPLPRPTPPR